MRGRPCGRQQRLGDAAPEVPDRQRAGVDDHVGPPAHVGELVPLALDALADRPRDRQRVGPPGLAEAGDQGLVGRLEEDDPRPHAGRLLDALEDRLEVLEPDPAAHVADHRRPLHPRALQQEEVGQRRQQPRRQVVHAEPAGVLEGAHRLALAGAAHAGDDGQLHAPCSSRSARGGLAGRRGLVEAVVHVAGDLGRHPRHRRQLVAAGRQEALGGAEVPQQRRLARRPDAGQGVEDALGHAAAAAAAVVAQREAVGLVADVLQHPQRRRALVQQQRRRDARARRPPPGAWRG